jgi:hypothetical protein
MAKYKHQQLLQLLPPLKLEMARFKFQQLPLLAHQLLR